MKDKLIKMLKWDEESGKYAPRPYKCSMGFNTVGWGYNIDANPLPGERYPMSLERADELLNQKVDYTISEVNKAIPWIKSLDESRQIVLYNMAYQMGVNGLLGFKKTLNELKFREYKRASIEMLNSNWVIQTSNRAMKMANIMSTGIITDKDLGIA